MLSFISVFQHTKSLIYIGSALISLIIVFFFYKKYQLSRYQMMIFLLLLLFWSCIIVARDYRKLFAKDSVDLATFGQTLLFRGGLGVGEIKAATIAAAYGLVSVFARMPFLALADFFKSKKFFIGLALITIFVSSSFVLIDPSYVSFYISSLAFGVGASLLAMFNVLFSESFSKEKALISVSILSIAPLLAEFLVAPLQYMATQTSPRIYSLLWLLSAIFALVCFIFLFFIKEKKDIVNAYTWKNFKTILLDYRFLTICVIGVLISFIRFSSSGNNLTAYANMIGMDSLLIAYLGVVFALSQLTSGILMGTFITKKIGVRNTLIIGIFLSASFTLLCSSITNPTFLFVAYLLNGFGYGLTYNVLIGIALQSFKPQVRPVSMGIFQTFFAVGIYFGDKIYAYVKQIVGSSFSDIALYQQIFLITTIVCVVTIGVCFLVFSRKNKNFLDKPQEESSEG